jgi:hypothetical protein
LPKGILQAYLRMDLAQDTKDHKCNQEAYSMSEIEPAGEHLRKAIKWISEERQEDDEKGIVKLIEEACIRFNLSPVDEVFLDSFFKEKGAQD